MCEVCEGEYDESDLRTVVWADGSTSVMCVSCVDYALEDENYVSDFPF